MSSFSRDLQRGAVNVGAAAFTLVLALAGAGAWWAVDRSKAAVAPPAAAPVAVRVATVEQRDVPHLTTGIGAVQSLHSVTLRSQVDGILNEVFFSEGQLVAAGDLLARIDDRAIVASLAQARAEMARNEAQLKSARLDFDRYDNLLRREAISKQAVDQQTAQVQQLEAAIAANRAAIVALEVQLSYTRITSPVSGRVGLRHVDPGNLVRVDDSGGLVTVTQIAPIAVIFSLPQERLARVQELLNAADAVVVTALDHAGGNELASGRLVLLDNQIDSTTGTIRLKAEFDNANASLWPGQFVTVQMQTGLSANALVVAVPAIQRGLEQPFVYRVTGDTVEAAPVVITYEDDDIAVIATGVAVGDVVVTDGQSRIKPGTAVKVSASAGTPDES